MKIYKKLFTMVLSCIMVVSMLPATVFAAEDSLGTSGTETVTKAEEAKASLDGEDGEEVDGDYDDENSDDEDYDDEKCDHIWENEYKYEKIDSNQHHKYLYKRCEDCYELSDEVTDLGVEDHKIGWTWAFTENYGGVYHFWGCQKCRYNPNNQKIFSDTELGDSTWVSKEFVVRKNKTIKVTVPCPAHEKISKVYFCSGKKNIKVTYKGRSYLKIKGLRKGQTRIHISMVSGAMYSYKINVFNRGDVITPSKVDGSWLESMNPGEVVVHWWKAWRNTGYEVYRATSKNGKYTKIKTIKGRSVVKFKDTKVTKGKRYYYKVRATRGKIKGKFSAIHSIVVRKISDEEYSNNQKAYVVNKINNIRADAGIAPLEVDDRLKATAQAYADYLYNDRFHDADDDFDFGGDYVVDEEGEEYIWHGECHNRLVAAGIPHKQCMEYGVRWFRSDVDDMIEDEDFLETVVYNERITHIGVGYHKDYDEGYWGIQLIEAE